MGTARLGKKTKDLVKSLTSDDIAIIDHEDIDRLSAEGLIASGVKTVVNAARSSTGSYPNAGPEMLLTAGIVVVDAVGKAIFDKVSDGDSLVVEDGIVLDGGKQVASGVELDIAQVVDTMQRAEAHIDENLEAFVSNTAAYIEKEKSKIIYDTWTPKVKCRIKGRQVLVVVRGQDYIEDLKMLASYITEVKPVLIGVDGGADALLERGYRPDVIVGDMDSVSDGALRCGAEVIAHVYEDEDGRDSTSVERLDALGITAVRWPISATSEDLALLLAWENEADLIVALGTHSNLIEYMEKGRKGMASTFLVRLKVGTKLVDAKGVNKLYRAAPPARYLFLVVAAALVAVVATVSISQPLRDAIILAWLTFRTALGF